MERRASSGYGATPVHRRSAAALQAKAARSVPRPGSAGQPQYANVLDLVIRDPIGLGVSGARTGGSRPASAGSTDASKLLQYASASKVKGGLGGAIGSAVASGVVGVGRAPGGMSSQSRLGTAKYSGASHASMWPPQPPQPGKAFGGTERRGGRGGDSSGDEEPAGATAASAPATKPAAVAAAAAAAAAAAVVAVGGNTAWERGAAPEPEPTTVRRLKEQKAHSTERLNMDNQQLAACPRLLDEEKLRLLNYQSNQIRTIQNLDGLPNLIFLDLYNNRIERVAGLEKVQGLRVLMLGKNRLTQIENLDGLSRLDVLDLHSNQITAVERLGHLSALRVLNLAGNRISRLQGVDGLVSLTELNLRRNVLTSMGDLSGLVSLQRLFLSHNQMPSTQSLHPLGALPQLLELSVEHNPLCSVTPPVYRPELLARLSGSLTKIDAQEVTQNERTAAQEMAVRRASEAARAAGGSADEVSPRARDDAADLRHTLKPATPRASGIGGGGGAAAKSNVSGGDVDAVQPASTMAQGMNVGHLRSREVGNGLPRRPSSPGESARVARIRDVMWEWEVQARHASRGPGGGRGGDEQGETETALGFYELIAAKRDDGSQEDDEAAALCRAEPGKELTQLSVYGWSALSALSDPAHAHISSLSLQFVAVDRMVRANLGAKLAALPSLTSISFGHNHLRSIGELEISIGGFLDVRAAVARNSTAAEIIGLRSLTIRENPLCKLGLCRDLVIRLCDGGARGAHRPLGSLRYLNGVAVTQAERSAAMDLFPFPPTATDSSGGTASIFEQPQGHGYGMPPGLAGKMTYEDARRIAEEVRDLNTPLFAACVRVCRADMVAMDGAGG